MLDDGAGWIIAGISVFVLLLAGLFIAAAHEDQEWQKFSIAHQCKIVGKVSGSSSTGVGIGTNGSVSVVPIYTPGKTGYSCNDGVTYWR